MKARLPHGGFTIIELVVVLAILGVLISLLVAAVQKVRSASLRAQCLNNLREMALLFTNTMGSITLYHQGFETKSWAILTHS